LDTDLRVSSSNSMRPRSLELTLDELPDEATVDGPAAFRVVIFNSLKDAGIDKDSIEGIECFSKTLWYVVFHERATRQKYRELTIKIFEKDYKLKSNEFDFTDHLHLCTGIRIPSGFRH
jgi:hypothetical protein